MNDTILVEAHTNRVSIPSAALDCGVDGGALFAMRAGSVKERRAVAVETLRGACAGPDAACEDMIRDSAWHFCPCLVRFGTKTASVRRWVAAVEDVDGQGPRSRSRVSG